MACALLSGTAGESMRAWALAVGLLVGIACGTSQPGGGSAGSGSGGGADGGSSGGGQDGGVSGTDGGSHDGGTAADGGTDAGTDGGADAGTGTDGGASTDGGVTVVPPTLGSNWEFAATAQGLPSGNVNGASADEGGNLWVAGGTQGLFLRRPGESKFHAFTLADGLHPYGYLAGQVATDLGKPQGAPADPNPSLDATPVLSVSGGPAGTVFVGYMGKPGCEDEWDAHGQGTLAQHEQADPAIYKSGDADKVTLSGGGITVAHYDIFSGPNVVAAEPDGREKLCSVFRIVYEHGSNHVWIGANHGFAIGFADFAGDPTCDGQINCNGSWEHVHPAFNDTQNDLVTGDYWGIAIDPIVQNGMHDIWFGGMARTTRFRWGQTNGDFFGEASNLTQAYKGANIAGDPYFQATFRNRIDVWPDAVGEYDASWNPTYPTPAQWQATLDLVSGIAAASDGSAYVASFAYGVRHLDHDGNILGDLGPLTAKNVSAIAMDTDGSIWVGYKYGGGFSRFKGGTVSNYDSSVLGDLASSAVVDIQIDTFQSPRRVILSFQSGAVGIYNGN